MQILKKEMKLKGFTITDLASIVGVTIGSVSGWVNGNAIPTPKYVKRLKDLGFSDTACLNPSKDIEV